MMTAGIGSALGSGLSLFGGLSGMFGGGGANSVQLPPMQPINTSGIQGNLNSSIPNLDQYNLGGQNLGQFQNVLQGTVNNPFASPAIQGAQAFGAQGAGNAYNIGSTVPGSIGAAGAILNNAFDPQNALFNQQQQLMSDQTLAGLSNSGLANTPWGQGVYGQNMGNFDINWQNNQLGREVTGAQGAEGLLTNAGQNANTAFNLGGTSTMAPYNTANTINTNALSALTGGASYGNAASTIPQTEIGDWLQYLSGANSANSVANTTAGLALQQNQQAFNQNQIFGQEIGSGLSGLFGGSSMFGGGGNPYSTQNAYWNSQVNPGSSATNFGWG